MHHSIPILRGADVIRLRRPYLQVRYSLKRAVMRYGYPEIDLLCACGNIFDHRLVFELKITLAPAKLRWRATSPTGRRLPAQSIVRASSFLLLQERDYRALRAWWSTKLSSH